MLCQQKSSAFGRKRARTACVWAREKDTVCKLAACRHKVCGGQKSKSDKLLARIQTHGTRRPSAGCAMARQAPAFAGGYAVKTPTPSAPRPTRHCGGARRHELAPRDYAWLSALAMIVAPNATRSGQPRPLFREHTSAKTPHPPAAPFPPSPPFPATPP